MKCYLCGTSDDLRPHGERGQPICFDCMKASPEREAEATKQFALHLGAITEEDIVLTEHGPVPASSVFGPEK